MPKPQPTATLTTPNVHAPASYPSAATPPAEAACLVHHLHVCWPAAAQLGSVVWPAHACSNLCINLVVGLGCCQKHLHPARCSGGAQPTRAAAVAQGCVLSVCSCHYCGVRGTTGSVSRCRCRVGCCLHPPALVWLGFLVVHQCSCCLEVAPAQKKRGGGKHTGLVSRRV